MSSRLSADWHFCCCVLLMLQRYPEITYVADAVLYNLHTTVRRMRGGGMESEAAVLMRLLMKQKAAGLCQFQFSLDSNNQLIGLFFATPHMLDNFERFGQMMIIDATCKTNR
jgi:hypothetical protein